MLRGCFIGRFQPFHEGHGRVIEEIAGEVDELVVGIGSAGASHSVHDPFTAGERIVMITRVLEDVPLPTYPVPIEDIDRHAVWASHVESMSPGFEVVYSNNPLVRRLFSEAGREVRQVEMHDRDQLEGTRIREAMIEGRDWRHLVPDGAVSVIEDVDGVDRIRQVSGTDANGR